MRFEGALVFQALGIDTGDFGAIFAVEHFAVKEQMPLGICHGNMLLCQSGHAIGRKLADAFDLFGGQGRVAFELECDRGCGRVFKLGKELFLGIAKCTRARSTPSLHNCAREFASPERAGN